MGTTQLGVIEQPTLDKRRRQGDTVSRVVSGGDTVFCNAAGTTTTAVTALPAQGTNDNNVVRRGERYKLFTSGGALKEETVFEVTNIAWAASQTITFTPAAAGATANGDRMRRVGGALQSMQDIDNALIATGLVCYNTQAKVDALTLNDKLFALQQILDPAAR